MTAILAELALTLGLLSNALASTTLEPILPQNAPFGGVLVQVEAKYDPPPQTSPECEISQGNGCIRNYIAQEAKNWGVSQYLALTIAEAESKFNPLARNPASSASGIFQFIKSTWKTECEGDVFDYRDNTRCAMRLLSTDNGLNHWLADRNMRQALKRAGIEF